MGIGNAYYDYGPVVPGGQGFSLGTSYPAEPWWDSEPGIDDLSDVLANLDRLASKNDDVFAVELCVADAQARDVEKWWQDLYGKINSGDAKYTIPGLHCTSAACTSIEFGCGAGPLLVTAGQNMSPASFLNALGDGLYKHTCGKNKGKRPEIDLVRPGGWR